MNHSQQIWPTQIILLLFVLVFVLVFLLVFVLAFFGAYLTWGGQQICLSYRLLHS
jgi:hypothetical protein